MESSPQIHSSKKRPYDTVFETTSTGNSHRNTKFKVRVNTFKPITK